MNLNRRIAMGKVRTSGCVLVLFGSLVFFGSSALGQTCTPVVYAFRHAEDTNPPGEHPPAGTVPIFALTPSGQAHAELYRTMVSEFQAANNFCPVAKVYATTTAEKVKCTSNCASATNAFDTATPLAMEVMKVAPITTVTKDDGTIKQLYEYLGNGNAAPTNPDYTNATSTALRKELRATANAGKSSAIFWTSQGLHVLGGAIVEGPSKVPDKNAKPPVVPPRNAVYIFKADGKAPNIAKFVDIPANSSLYVQCFNFVGASIGVSPPGPRFINPEGSPPQRTQLYYCGYGPESVLGGQLPEGCALNAQCGRIPNDQNKDIKGKICNTTTSMAPKTAGTNTFGACKFNE
jgi:hypothetical protein